MGCVNRHRKLPVNNNFLESFLTIVLFFYSFISFFQFYKYRLGSFFTFFFIFFLKFFLHLNKHRSVLINIPIYILFLLILMFFFFFFFGNCYKHWNFHFICYYVMGKVTHAILILAKSNYQHINKIMTWHLKNESKLSDKNSWLLKLGPSKFLNIYLPI